MKEVWFQAKYPEAVSGFYHVIAELGPRISEEIVYFGNE